MNKYIYIIGIVLFSLNNKLYAQNFSNTTPPNENIFLHFNTSFFITGESIYYKIYCIDAQTKQLSTLSKIAYIDLIDKDYKSIFRHKIKLENGLGSGDLFIPSDIKSGNYKLIAYTQWMCNWPNNYFQNDISIVNPFGLEQTTMLSKNDSLYTVNTHLTAPLKTIEKKKNSNGNLTLNLSKKNYTSREKITLNIHSLDKKNTLGNYSVSVNKIDSIIIPRMYSAANFNQLFKNSSYKNVQFLPELRGELISGKVLDSNKQPLQKTKVALSIPGKNFIFKIATTNSNGNFYTYLNNRYDNDHAIFQIIDSPNDQLSLSIDSTNILKLENLEFSNFKITPAMTNNILKRSIQSQIENSYTSVKLNRVDSISAITPFYKSKTSKTYVLDDYTRFPTVKETLVEITPNIYVKTRQKQSTVNVIIYEEKLNQGDLLPMILIDGVLIQDHDELLAYNPYNIDKIHVIGSQYVYSTKVYDGIIAIETKKGNYDITTNGNFIKKIKLFKPLVKKEYYKQVYLKGSEFNRIPDYRNLLLWEPDLTLTKGENSIVFYSSDVPGFYEIRLEGFDTDGLAVSLQEIIKVD